MYQPKTFIQEDRARIADLIRAYPLATLVHASALGPDADHLPLLFDPSVGTHGVLRGHVARANPLWRQADGQSVLAVFHGPQAYVSPRCYPSKQAHGRVVPTWNYAVVHAHGVLRTVDDAVYVRGVVDALTAQHEAGSPAPWALADAPADYVAQMLGAIVGIEITLSALTGKWKLSQNRERSDRDGVVTVLDAQGQTDASRWVADAGT